MAHADRIALAQRRLQLVLRTSVVANWRTLEQKISDAGPGAMRVDPHILTQARAALIDQGVIVRKTAGATGSPWFHLRSATDAAVQAKLSKLVPIHDALQQHNFKSRMGQTLEIAAYRAFIAQPAFSTFGAYLDLDAHDDSSLYIKEEPPSVISGRRTTGKLDFIRRFAPSRTAYGTSAKSQTRRGRPGGANAPAAAYEHKWGAVSPPPADSSTLYEWLSVHRANLAAYSRNVALRLSSASCVSGTMIGAPSSANA